MGNFLAVAGVVFLVFAFFMAIMAIRNHRHSHSNHSGEGCGASQCHCSSANLSKNQGTQPSAESQFKELLPIQPSDNQEKKCAER